MARYLLDTDTFIHLRGGRNPTVQRRFAALEPGDAVISVVSFGELLYGAEKSVRRDATLQILDQLITIVPVIDLTIDAARAYGVFRRHLERAGEMIGSNDLWIAAQAHSASLIVVTSNEREFRRIPGLKVENWVS
jgi:tRNA(fMet)-specific endonuclease VapC